MKKFLMVAFLVASSQAFAQQPTPFAPVSDRDLWEAMNRAFAELPISLTAHQQIQQIMANVQREAQVREARAKAEAAKAEKP